MAEKVIAKHLHAHNHKVTKLQFTITVKHCKHCVCHLLVSARQIFIHARLMQEKNGFVTNCACFEAIEMREIDEDAPLKTV